jgi:hypothetical protein
MRRWVAIAPSSLLQAASEFYIVLDLDMLRADLAFSAGARCQHAGQ